jgi:hypothetical protein
VDQVAPQEVAGDDLRRAAVEREGEGSEGIHGRGYGIKGSRQGTKCGGTPVALLSAIAAPEGRDNLCI